MDIQKIKRAPSCPDAIFSILIPTWNNLPYLRCLLASLAKNSHFQHQIILIINEGSDGTLEWVRNETCFDYVYSAENIGICYGLNAARSLVATEYICYFNDDMYACPSWDKALWEHISTLPNQKFFISSTMIEPMDHKNPCVLVADFGDTYDTFQEEALLAALPSLQKVDWLGATWPPNVLHRDMWDLIGGMSIEFSPGMYSDPDLSRKLWAVGVRHFLGLGTSFVYHFGSKSTGKVKRNKGKDTFLLKWRHSSSSFTEQTLQRGLPFSTKTENSIVEISFLQQIKRALATFRKN